MKTYKEFLNESYLKQSSKINWTAIEEFYANQSDLPDCLPRNVREWENFIKQYERACEIQDGTFKLNYTWKDDREKDMSVDQQLYLNKGYKRSVYECYIDLQEIAGDIEHSKILYDNGFTWDPIENTLNDLKWVEMYEDTLIPTKEIEQFLTTLKKLHKIAVSDGFEPIDTLDYLKKKLGL